MKKTILLFFTAFSSLVYSQNGNQRDQIPQNKIHIFTKAEELAHHAQYQDKSTSCAAALNAPSIQLQSCSDVGTSNFFTQGTDMNFANSVATPPSIAESCAGANGYSTTGTWMRANPDPGVQIIDLLFLNGSVGSGNHSIFIQFFQGNDCNSLSAIGCSELATIIMGIYTPINIHLEQINDSQDIWMYVWDDSGKSFNLDFEIIGSGVPVTNTECATASTDSIGCNLGADADTEWTGPNNNGKTCSGGTWYTNENTTYYEIYPTSVDGTVSVTNVICNDGVAGQAQFGVWKSCACVGTYTAACYVSCAVGTGTLSLTGMVPGQMYILVVDGQAGDICTWEINLTGANFSSGLSDLKSTQNISVFPNPASTVLNIEGADLTDFDQLRLVDVLGRVILESNINQSKVELNLEHVAVGSYTLQLNGKQVQTSKSVIIFR